jgi:hypothetical protein
MKYTLTIEADSATELFDALVASATVYRLSDAAEPRDVPEPIDDAQIMAHTLSPLPDTSAATTKRATLPTGDDPADVYGPGNGPVGAHRPDATPASEPTMPTVDANNMPHDERIHAGSKALNADGTWRKKRGVSDELIRSVEAECITSTVYADNVSGSLPVLTITDASKVSLAPLAPTPASIMSRIAALVTSGDKTPAYVQEIAKSCDLADGIAQIASDSDALQRVVAALQADGVL